MMKPAAIALVLAVTMGDASALRTIEDIEGSYELALPDVSLPSSFVRSVSFKPCAGCDVVVLPVTSSTQYFCNHVEVSLADFLSTVEQIRRSHGAVEHTGVGVFFDLRSQRVTRITLHRWPD